MCLSRKTEVKFKYGLIVNIAIIEYDFILDDLYKMQRFGEQRIVIKICAKLKKKQLMLRS